MSNLQLSQIELPETVTCVICARAIASEDATFGAINADGEVTTLCNGHLSDGRHLINMLADYMAEQRRMFLSNDDGMSSYGRAADAWALY